MLGLCEMIPWSRWTKVARHFVLASLVALTSTVVAALYVESVAALLIFVRFLPFFYWSNSPNHRAALNRVFRRAGRHGYRSRDLSPARVSRSRSPCTFQLVQLPGRVVYTHNLIIVWFPTFFPRCLVEVSRATIHPHAGSCTEDFFGLVGVCLFHSSHWKVIDIPKYQYNLLNVNVVVHSCIKF